LRLAHRLKPAGRGKQSGAELIQDAHVIGDRRELLPDDRGGGNQVRGRLKRSQPRGRRLGGILLAVARKAPRGVDRGGHW
jgi:hypothetical protein